MAAVTDKQIAAIGGWFRRVDIEFFRVLLEATGKAGPGDLAELGVYLGKSAALIGSYLQNDEVFTVVDLFGRAAAESDNRSENDRNYGALTRAAFEATYSGLHGTLPVVVEGPSSSILDHARHGQHRFVHIDASHLYQHVVEDIAAAQILLRPDGVVVLDDYRFAHTPGVAAAAWQAVGAGLHPFLLTPVKMYATWGDASPCLDVVARAVADRDDLRSDWQTINGNRILRVVTGKPPGLAGQVSPATLSRLRRLRFRATGR